jgi:hypothetical protein
MNNPLPNLSAGRIAWRWLFLGVMLLASYASVLAGGGGPVVSIQVDKTVNENGITAMLTVTVTGLQQGQGCSVEYTCTPTNPATALPIDDYTNVSGTLSFQHPITTAFIGVPIVNDLVPEGDETFLVVLNNPLPLGATIGKGTCTVKITDDDSGGGGSATVEFESTSWTCGENGLMVTIKALMTGTPSGPVSVSYATSDGSAKAGSDYTAASGFLTWQTTESGMTKSFTVTILTDSIVEPTESVNLTLSNPINASLNPLKSSAILSITDDDEELCP